MLARMDNEPDPETAVVFFACVWFFALCIVQYLLLGKFSPSDLFYGDLEKDD